jgi:ABC-type nickel/cobalt efflux system permease component RcnA
MAALTLVVIQLAPVAAHPLGNFSVNRYSRLAASDDQLHVHYVLDLAEIPAFQEGQLIDVNSDGRVDDAEAATYAARRARSLADRLALTVDGRATPLSVQTQRIVFPLGQGGLTTLRLEVELTAPLTMGAPVAVAYHDLNEPDRLGWREIVVVPGTGRAVQQSSAPQSDVSHELTAYPDDLLSTPLDVRQVSFTAAPVAASAAPSPARSVVPERARDAFAALVTTEALTPWTMAVALLIAFGLGALHALSPGHGKAVVASYLVGARGTVRHALALGLTVTVTHTLGVFLLGFATLFLSNYILPERLFPWLSAISGLLIVGIGLGLLRARLADAVRLRSIGRPAPTLTPALAHQHADGVWHTHSYTPQASGAATHRHGWFAANHDHGPGGHTHAPLERLTWRGLLALGVSGGLVPCPSALVVLLGAVALQRIGLGLVLIVAFSAGLAAVLTGIGLLLVVAARAFSRLPTDNLALRVLPLISAGVVTIIGVVLVAQALAEARLV